MAAVPTTRDVDKFLGRSRGPATIGIGPTITRNRQRGTSSPQVGTPWPLGDNRFSPGTITVDDPSGNLSTGPIPCVPDGATGTWMVGGYIRVGEGAGWAGTLTWLVTDVSAIAPTPEDRRLTTDPAEGISVGPIRTPISGLLLFPAGATVSALLAFDDVPATQPTLTMHIYAAKIT